MWSARWFRGLWWLLLLLATTYAVAQKPQRRPDLTGPAPHPWTKDSSTAQKHFASDRLIVRFRAGKSAAARAATHKFARGKLKRRLRTLRDIEVVQLEAGDDVRQALRRYRTQADVLYVEPDYIRTLQDVVPNDPMFSGLWGLRNTGQSGGTIGADIDAANAWTLSTGSNEVVVGTIDTGVDWNHPDLAANIYRNDGDCTANGIDDDGNGFVDDCHGFNGAAEQGDPIDTYGHGTHVAGTIGAVGNNGLGVVGVNWRVKILACKTDDEAGYLYDSAIIACLDYMAEMKDRGVNIVATNNSYGGGDHSQAEDDAIREQMQRGILFIAAAGNYAIDNDQYGVYPANTELPNVIAVAATDRKDLRAFFSDYGRHTVHLGAPGVAITSTVPGGGYDTWDGTSMATPHVVGAAALLKAYDPTLDWVAIKNRILSGGDPVTSLANTITGRRLNVYGALTCANQQLTGRLLPRKSTAYAAVGEPLTLSVLHIVCANPAGPVSVTLNPGSPITLQDDGLGADVAPNDGVYTGRWVPPAVGRYTATFSTGDVVTVNVLKPYRFSRTDYQWRDFAGQRLSLGDEGAMAILSPFPFRFGGLTFTRVAISSNGGIQMLAPGEPAGFGISPYSMYLPTNLADTLVALFWDDLLPWRNHPDRNVFWTVLGSPPNRELVIEWRGIRHYFEAGWPPALGNADFQVVYFENRDDVLFNYADTTFDNEWYDYGAQASVGIQVSQSVAMQFSWYEPSLFPEMSLRWNTCDAMPTSLEIESPYVGVVWEPGTTATIAWTASGPAATSFRIELLKGDAIERVISPSVPAVAGGIGKYTWTVPQEQAHGSDYSVRLVSNTDSSVSHTTARFVIEDKSELRLLSILLADYGGGTVTSSPPGLECRRVCDVYYPVGTTLTLIPTPDAGSMFKGWGGACTAAGTGSCVVTLAGNTDVEASFVVIPTITITSPNGGEEWVTGTSHPIRWEFTEPNDRTAFIGVYKVFAGGGGFGLVQEVALNASLAARFYPWVIPANFENGEYFVEIVSRTEPFQIDQSDANFRLVASGLTVTSPNGGEYWPPGTLQTVRWTTRGAVGTYVRIDLYKNGVLNRTLSTAKLATSGSFAWTVPATQTQGADYKIRVASTTNAAYNDMSDGAFSIMPVQVTVTSPNGGELWRPGTMHAITWTTTGPVGTDARIELLQGNAVDSVIHAAAPLSTGSHGWTVPPAQAHGSYTIRITSNQVAGISDTSNASFTIDDLYAVSVAKAGTGSGTVASSPPGINCGTTCQANFSNGDIVTLTATPAAGHVFTGWSGACTGTESCALNIDGDKQVTATFTIPPPGITVTTPNGGEQWTTGTAQTIRWSYVGSPGATARIYLLKGGVLNRTLTTAAAISARAFSWVVPNTVASGSDYAIRITSATNAAVTDTSDAPFSILGPQVTVTSPNGGEFWPPGTVQTVRWTTRGAVGTYVRIDLYKNGVLNRTLSTARLATSGSFAWTVPVTQAQGADYKIRVASTTNAAYNDMSDATFSIVPVGITLTAPNGGELWRPGTTHPITWTTTGPVGTDAKIELLSGTTVAAIIADTVSLAAGSHLWTVPPQQAHGTYTVRITSNQVPGILDASHGSFTIGDLYALAVSKAGTGAGTVTSSPAGINCGVTCSGNFSSGAEVILTATPSPGHSHTGWSGHCTGTGPCTLTMDDDKAVTATFTAPPTGIRVSSPNGGEAWGTGTVQVIRWSYTGPVGAYVRIELLKNGSLHRRLASAASVGANGNGAYTWTVPATQLAASDYTIRVTSTSNAAYTDTSDGAFRITGPGITLVSPNGGESWQRGTAHPIRWTLTGAVGSYVRLDLYRAGVWNRTIITATGAGTGTFNWTIPATQITGADYRIKITSTSNAAYTDQSDANFSITQ